MASWSEMNTGSRTAVGAVILILLGGGYAIWQANQPVAVPANGPAQTEVTAPAAPIADLSATADATSAPATEPVAEAAAPATDADAAAGTDAATPDVPAETATAEAEATPADTTAADTAGTDAADAAAAVVEGVTEAPDATDTATGTDTATADVTAADVGTSEATTQTEFEATAPETTTAETTATEAATAEVATSETATTEAVGTDSAATPSDVPATVASLDLVRIEPDGTSLVAGQATPGALVSLLVDGVVVATATADKAGKFVAMFTLPPSASGQLLTMVAKLPDGTEVESGSQIAIATITPPPVVTADAGATTEDEAAVTADAGTVATVDSAASADAGTVQTADTVEPAADEAATATTADTSTADAGAAADATATEEPSTAEVASDAGAETAADAGAETVADAVVETATAPVVTAAPEAPVAPAATATTTALAVTDQGVKVLQSGANVPADLAANVSLSTIAYPSLTEVQFGGRGTPGNFVRLYLNNEPAGDPATIAADGTWSLTVAGIEPRIYTLRVDQIDTTGKVTSRFETPFKRETPEALAAASGHASVAAATDGGGIGDWDC